MLIQRCISFSGPINSKETSYLAKNLKPGTTYTIRVAAYSILGVGSATSSYVFDIPGMRLNHGDCYDFSSPD